MPTFSILTMRLVVGIVCVTKRGNALRRLRRQNICDTSLLHIVNGPVKGTIWSESEGYNMRHAARGFTLIELLIVIVIIGILATIAIPKFSRTKSKGYVATVKSDIRNLMTAQESYFGDNNTYATSAQLTAENRYTPSSGVNLTLAGVSATGWSATATHSGLVDVTACGVFVGSAAPPNAACTIDGEVACW